MVAQPHTPAASRRLMLTIALVIVGAGNLTGALLGLFALAMSGYLTFRSRQRRLQLISATAPDVQ